MSTENEDGFAADVTEQEETQTQETQQTQETTKPGVDFEAALEKLGEKITTSLKPIEKTEETKLSPEDEAKLWAIYNPEATRKDFIQKLFKLNPEATPEDVADAKAMWQELQQGLVKQSVVGARNLYQAELSKFKKELEERYAPMEKHFSETRAEKLQTAFYKEYPALGVQVEDGSFKYQKAINLAANELASKTFPDQKSYFKALADGAAEIVKGILPDFDLGAAKQTTKKSASTPSLPRTRVGGSGGTSAGGGETAVQRGAGDDAQTLDWTAAS